MNYLNGVSLFVQVTESGSFVDAARLAGISPSAVSKSISRLEQRLSVRLFHRSTRSLSLTTEGKIYLETCHKVLAELQSVESKLGQSIVQPQGVLRISLPMVSGFFTPDPVRFQLPLPCCAIRYGVYRSPGRYHCRRV
ncbi:LysR family transcriptional regulator [Chania multitudinisentens]|uniref:LysR family transcriptional regulator n=1 Tax=Chania multitudinisentens TaxID=1639108 RepID=UPI001F028B16|nr:LysR family transcriptional regulator [Chania multitudinisentens]